MPAVRSVLVIGAGAAGTATAILLAERGVSVDLVDVKPDIGALGSGITLQGNALRVFRQLGVWDEIAERGYPFNSLGIRAPDPHGTLVAEIPDARTGGPDLPPPSACIALSWPASSLTEPSRSEPVSASTPLRPRSRRTPTESRSPSPMARGGGTTSSWGQTV